MADVARRNGIYGGWTHAGTERIFVRVASELKRRSASWNGSRPELETTPIVLVHGFSSSRALRPLIKALGTRRAVFAPDLPGFGMSEHPVHPLDVPDLADSLRRWLFDNDLAPAILIGVSFGCQVAIDLAARNPTAVDRLVLIGPAFDPDARTPGRLAMRWARNVPRSSPRLAPTVVHDLIDAGPWRSIRTLRRALADPTEEKLELIEAPTLIVRPKRDHLVRAEWTERVAELIPDSELIVLPKAGHSIRHRTAARLTALLDLFLAETEPHEAIDEPDERAEAT
jgi:pimeloyl-ACP methyl ester carboxylesterase